MRINAKWAIFILICVCLSSGIVEAAEYATFESFYRKHIEWWQITALTALATASVVAILVTGGLGTGPIGAMGTWVGGLMGYSGAAATNTGLAFLGGGSIATGGMGMVGGAALLTAALTGANVGSEVVIDRSFEEYSYAKFAKQSRGMTTLPLPRNTSGPDLYEAALHVLGKTNDKEPLASNFNQGVIQEAIQAISSASDEKPSNGESARSRTLLALLYFLQNDYLKAKQLSMDAYSIARQANDAATLPSFIYGTSLLYDERMDFNTALTYFNYSINGEPNNLLTPLLFTIFLDRMMYRLNDGQLSPPDLDRVYAISNLLAYDERKAVIQLGLLNRYFIRLWSERDTIVSFTNNENKVIKDSPKTLIDIKAALKRYKELLNASKIAMADQSALVRNRLNSEIGIFDKARGKGIKKWEIKWNEELGNRHPLWEKYSIVVKELELRVNNLEIYQKSLKAKKSAKQKKNAEADGYSQQWHIYAYFGIAFLLMLGTVVFSMRRR